MAKYFREHLRSTSVVTLLDLMDRLSTSRRVWHWIVSRLVWIVVRVWAGARSILSQAWQLTVTEWWWINPQGISAISSREKLSLLKRIRRIDLTSMNGGAKLMSLRITKNHWHEVGRVRTYAMSHRLCGVEAEMCQPCTNAHWSTPSCWLSELCLKRLTLPIGFRHYHDSDTLEIILYGDELSLSNLKSEHISRLVPLNEFSISKVNMRETDTDCICQILHRCSRIFELCHKDINCTQFREFVHDL